MSKEFNYNEVEEGVSDYLKELLDSVPKDLRASMTESIILQSIIWGSYNVYEAVGILECAKRSYLESFEKVILEQDED